MTGYIFAFMTGEYVTEESAAFGDAESRGWVDTRWSRTEFFDSRNDVSPLFSCPEDDPTLPFGVREAIAELSAPYDNGDGTYYAQDAVVHDYTQPGHYMYAVHFIRKGPSSEGYRETAWHPSSAGIDTDA